MNKYRTLISTPPKLEVRSAPKEVVFYVISAMCDNDYTITFTRNDDKSYNVSGGRFSLRNFSMQGDWEQDLRWLAQDGEWQEVIAVINTGNIVVERVRCRA
jgi:hypothetical protein